ncbi:MULTISPECIES: class I SAM-dependent methyltransferase [Paenibacillus]|uniref:class I SAM-dependent methyltransferase n=1 Tax=Paenibacillus TaxID=44249 RepID=UPI0022B92532|nr:class I SAM-dependent methyltransferase [Paenibacillus caseinilyticus]MCZ8522169.1 class I SAM-dependent methyltransferase [Paenibacillus caseinilyticus]
MEEAVIKRELAQSYDKDAARRTAKTLPGWKLREREEFLHSLQEASCRTLLEIGSGPGIDAAFFSEQGLDVMCTDLSAAMVDSCRERGLQAEVMDFYALGLPDGSFDGVYAMNCLLHVPKADFEGVLKEMSRVLKPGGLTYLGLYGGRESEGLWEDDWCEPPRFFSFHGDREILRRVSPVFHVEGFGTVPQKGELHYQSMVLRKPR